MVIARQMEVRSEIKKYFDMAFAGETVVVPRKQNKNVVIISETEYSRLSSLDRLSAYSASDGSMKKTDAEEREERNNNIKTDNADKLKVISNLKEGWNGNGAPSFADEVIAKALEIILALEIQPEVFPTALGTIQLEFNNSRRDHMEIEIGNDGPAEVFIVKYNGEEYIEQISADTESINCKVKDFYG